MVRLAGFVDSVLSELLRHGHAEKANLRQSLLAVRGAAQRRLSNRLLCRLQTVNTAFKVVRHLDQLDVIMADLKQELESLSSGTS